jgi:hypothetical protein
MREFILMENGLKKATFENAEDAINCVLNDKEISLDNVRIMEHVLIEKYETIPYSKWHDILMEKIKW